MPLPSRSWTVSCRTCDLIIGTVEDGRFVHEQACTAPLAIGAGLLRCCQCGGPLAGDPRPLAPREVPADVGAGDARAVQRPQIVPPLQFRRPDLSGGEVLRG
jgi:hypothetical protein